MKFSIAGLNISWGKELVKPREVKTKASVKGTLPPGRVSEPDFATDDQAISSLREDLKIVTPDYILDIIPVIRKLSIVHPDLSQALDNIVQLGNTGHTVKFSADVTEAEANAMINHLNSRKLEWAEGSAGMDGLVNKMISQLMIAGAISCEWVPNVNLDGIRSVILIRPETIRFAYNRTLTRWEPYQKIKSQVNGDLAEHQLVKLNEATFKYYGLNGDTDIPYGNPPYLPALASIATQKDMLDNIKYIIKQVGIMGFLQVMVDKPDKKGDESEATYITRLDAYLVAIKSRIVNGLKDGTTVGFKDDYEFEFQSINKDPKGVTEIFNLNELQIASGLKQDASLMGRSYGTTETQITVIFTKLLSQIKNIQNLIKRNLEFGYDLDLRLGGFKFKGLEVIFNQSTVLDELKYQQGIEIKIRNYNDLYYDGIISQDQYANAMGYEKSNVPEPRYIRNNATTDAAISAAATKNESAQKSRKTNKPQEKTIK